MSEGIVISIERGVSTGKLLRAVVRLDSRKHPEKLTAIAVELERRQAELRRAA